MILPIEAVTGEYNRGVSYLEKKNYKKALQYFKRALAIYPCMEVHNNLGVTYRELDMDALMWKHYKLALTPGLPSLTGTPDVITVQVLNNLGLAHYMYGQDDKALEMYRAAIKINPKAWDCWWNTSTAWLRKASSSGLTEDFAHGWEMYRARFLKSSPIKMKNMKENLVYWDTVSSGESIIVLTEQGIGDNLMFARYLDRLHEKFDRVYIQCDSSLNEVFSKVAIPVRDASECDATVAYPICSLGECFPSVTQNYDWLRGKFGEYKFDSGPNVGIVFSGNPDHANDRNRSVNIQRFYRLAKYANLYCIQPGVTGDKKIKCLNPTSWIQTAEYINGLDLVIGVDTSSMHLCGALGANGWLLQPLKETDFRWGTGSGSVWYPNIKVYNNPQSWETVFDKVEEDLERYFS